MRFIRMLFIFMAGCPCLPIPTTDPTAPEEATVSIEYRRVGGGPRVTLTRSVGDEPFTVTADKSDVISAVYSGYDPQGLRSVELVYSLSDGGLLLELKETSNCPRASLAGQHTFEASIIRRQYTFASRAENWLGLKSTSATFTVMAQ